MIRRGLNLGALIDGVSMFNRRYGDQTLQLVVNFVAVANVVAISFYHCII